MRALPEVHEDRWQPCWQKLKIQNVATITVFFYRDFPEIIRTHLVDSNSPRNSTSKVFPCYGPLRRISLSAMGHCGGFGYALWATTADLVICYGPLRRIWLCAMGQCGEWSRTVKICIDFCAMGHRAGFGYALRAIAQGLVIRDGR